MKSLKKVLITLALTTVLSFAMILTVNAASSGDWDIDYTPYAPSPISNQISTVTVSYDSAGYYAYCSRITGVNGRALEITSSDAGGMSPISITTAGRTASWKMRGGSTGDVVFIVSAVTGYQCESTGTIYQNN